MRLHAVFVIARGFWGLPGSGFLPSGTSQGASNGKNHSEHAPLLPRLSRNRVKARFPSAEGALARFPVRGGATAPARQAPARRRRAVILRMTGVFSASSASAKGLDDLIDAGEGVGDGGNDERRAVAGVACDKQGSRPDPFWLAVV